MNCDLQSNVSGREETLICLLHQSPKFYNVSYSLAQQLWEFFLNFNWFIKLSVQTFQPLIEIYRRGHFVYHHCGCTYSTPRYVPLSYPFRYLPMSTQALKMNNLLCPSVSILLFYQCISLQLMYDVILVLIGNLHKLMICFYTHRNLIK